MPLVGLTATVIVGATLGLWMLVTATSTSSQAAAPHDETVTSAVHEHEGTVAMPGLEAAPQEQAHGTHADESVATGDMTDTHPAAEASGRPLAATLAGFGVVNVAVLIAAALVGRSRRGSAPRPQAGARKRAATVAGSPPAERAQTPSTTGTAGNPS